MSTSHPGSRCSPSISLNPNLDFSSKTTRSRHVRFSPDIGQPIQISIWLSVYEYTL